MTFMPLLAYVIWVTLAYGSLESRLGPGLRSEVPSMVTGLIVLVGLSRLVA